jgi:precorrin-2 dehydrogenase/sirohydrochlorin ferrochelatase
MSPNREEMRDMLIDLKLAGKTVLIFGGGNIGEKKARKFSQANSTVVVVSKNFTNDLKRLGQQEKLKLVEAEVEVNSPSTTSLISKSDLIIAATDNPKLNEDITKEARKRGILVCAVDRPSISDFHLPAIAHVGEIRIAVSTGGKSPAMARILRKRVEEIITKEDALQVALQHYARNLAKSRIPDEKARRSILYQIIQNPNVKRLLKEGNLKEAEALAKQIIENY